MVRHTTNNRRVESTSTFHVALVACGAAEACIAARASEWQSPKCTAHSPQFSAVQCGARKAYLVAESHNVVWCVGVLSSQNPCEFLFQFFFRQIKLHWGQESNGERHQFLYVVYFLLLSLTSHQALLTRCEPTVKLLPS